MAPEHPILLKDSSSPISKMDDDLKTLLQDDLKCSEAFLQRVEEREVNCILALMDNLLDPDNGGEPDVCDMLRLFHDDTDSMDPQTRQS